MKRFVAILICVSLMCFMGACNKNIFGTNPTRDTRPTAPSTTNTVSADFDFQTNGVVIQTQQYGKCKIELTSNAKTAILYLSGKNLCGGVAGTDLPREQSGIVFSRTKTGHIIATGTATGNPVCYVAGKLGGSTTNADRIFLQEGSYTLSGCPEGGSSSTYRLRAVVVNGNGEATYYNDYGAGISFTLSEAAHVAICAQIMAGTTVDNLQFAPQLELGNEATEYESYFGKKYAVNIENGSGTLEIELDGSEESASLYTFMSSGSGITLHGFGTVKASIQPLWHATQPHFVIIDDDGKDEVYTILMPLLNDRGIPFATSVIPSKLDKTGYLTVEQLKAVAEAGNKVLCHSKNHRNLKNDAITYEERYEEIVGGKQMLADLGFDVDTMVYPNGSYDDEVLKITKAHYKYGIATSGDTPWGQQRYNEDPVNPYVIERVNIGSYYNGQTAEEKAAALEDAKKNIDVCIEKNYLCVIMTHIGDAGEDGIAQIIELINYVESKGYSFVDLDTAIQAHIPPE